MTHFCHLTKIGEAWPSSIYCTIRRFWLL